MEDRSVWRLVLSDILDVIPLRTVSQAVISMSSRELKDIAVRATRIDTLFEKDIVYPVKLESISCSKIAATIQITPGGQWIVIMHKDGSLNLHQTRDFGVPLVRIPRPECSPSHSWDELAQANMDVRVTSLGEPLVIISDTLISTK